jgi:IS30 family transposase
MVLRATGGIAPSRRHRSIRSLSLAEREEISRGLASGESMRSIALRLGRSASTVCREVNRHGGGGNYRATKADESAWDRARRPKRCLLAVNRRLRDVVEEKLKEHWSPQQISGWLAKRYPGEEVMRVSAETIYRTLFIQARGALKKELIAHLRSKRTMRHSRNASRGRSRRGQIKDAVSIRERPPEAEDRAVPGHWEGDLILGTRNTYVATLVERTSRFVMLVRVGGKDTESVVKALSAQIRRLPKTMMDTLTWDRGAEMAGHKKFTIATDVAVYFCDPSSPWQRGTNENTNRLLRQYLPKGRDLSVHSQQELDLIALKLNSRPRKTLDYSTPADTLAQTVALTG